MAKVLPPVVIARLRVLLVVPGRAELGFDGAHQVLQLLGADIRLREDVGVGVRTEVLVGYPRKLLRNAKCRRYGTSGKGAGIGQRAPRLSYNYQSLHMILSTHMSHTLHMSALHQDFVIFCCLWGTLLCGIGGALDFAPLSCTPQARHICN